MTTITFRAHLASDRRLLRHKTPCRECPFRKSSPAGFLGGYPLEPYRQPPSVGIPTTCHCSDFGADDPRSSLCAGSLATIANDPDAPVLSDYAEAVEAVGPRDDCHASVSDFAEHHRDADLYARHRGDL